MILLGHHSTLTFLSWGQVILISCPGVVISYTHSSCADEKIPMMPKNYAGFRQLSPPFSHYDMINPHYLDTGLGWKVAEKLSWLLISSGLMSVPFFPLRWSLSSNRIFESRGKGGSEARWQALLIVMSQSRSTRLKFNHNICVGLSVVTILVCPRST